jgi:pimeloyl-ACP methyl ester carboxylesterase
MSEATRDGVTIYYETDGDPAAVPLLMIMGLGAQMTSWPPELRAALVERGFLVICFDNRDVGRSTWLDDAGAVDLLAVLAGEAEPAYLLSAMAADSMAVLDAIGVDSAHVLGVSMGGMIAQTVAIEYPSRVRTLTSIMSTTGDPAVGRPHPDVLAGLMDRSEAQSQDEAVAAGLLASEAISSPGFPWEEDRIRARLATDYVRGYHPDGSARQLAAILGSPDRTPALAALRVPTLVIHGDADPLIDVSGGRATAHAIPGARLKVVAGMGHDLPLSLCEQLADDVAGVAGLAAGIGPAR